MSSCLKGIKKLSIATVIQIKDKPFAAANTAINAALKEKSVIDSLAIQGMLPVGGTAAQMAADQKIQFDYWGPIVKKVGFTAEA